MAERQKLLPESVPEWQLPYWHGLRDRKVLVQKCTSCGTLRHIPKELCASCHQTGYAWHPLSGLGTVYTYTVVYRAPSPVYQVDAPYAIAHVEMDEGVRMIADVVEVDSTSVEIGLPVKAIFDDVTDQWTMLRFAPR
ncbi:Zn-ribbon domain-containing OB-fold protein [Jatrophihabitans sp. DSM 45814]